MTMTTPMTRLLLALVRGYQRWLSPLKGRPTCRFIPSCSEYAADAIRARGPLSGTGLAFWRILRCQPLCAGGYDPVHHDAPRDGTAEPRPEPTKVGVRVNVRDAA